MSKKLVIALDLSPVKDVKRAEIAKDLLNKMVLANEDDESEQARGVVDEYLPEGQAFLDGINRGVIAKAQSLPADEQPEVYTKQFSPAAYNKLFTDSRFILSDEELDEIVEAAKDATECKLYLLSHFSNKTKTFAGESYSEEIMAGVLNRLMERGISPDKICLAACKFGVVEWQDDVTQRRTHMWNFLEKILDNPVMKKPGLKISSFGAAVFFDSKGRKQFNFRNTELVREYKESLSSDKKKKNYKIFAMYDAVRDRWLEITRREYTAKPNIDLSNVPEIFYKEDEKVIRDRAFRNELGTSSYELIKLTESFQGKLLFVDQKGNAFFSQLDPPADPQKIIQVQPKHHAFNSESEIGQYFGMQVEKAGRKVESVDITPLNFTNLQGLIFQLANMTDEQVCNYSRVRIIGGLEKPYTAEEPGIVVKKSEDGNLFIQCRDKDSEQIRLLEIFDSQIPTELEDIVGEIEIGKAPPAELVKELVKLDQEERNNAQEKEKEKLLQDTDVLISAWEQQEKKLVDSGDAVELEEVQQELASLKETKQLLSSTTLDMQQLNVQKGKLVSSQVQLIETAYSITVMEEYKLQHQVGILKKRADSLKTAYGQCLAQLENLPETDLNRKIEQQLEKLTTAASWLENAEQPSKQDLSLQTDSLDQIEAELEQDNRHVRDLLAAHTAPPTNEGEISPSRNESVTHESSAPEAVIVAEAPALDDLHDVDVSSAHERQSIDDASSQAHLVPSSSTAEGEVPFEVTDEQIDDILNRIPGIALDNERERNNITGGGRIPRNAHAIFAAGEPGEERLIILHSQKTQRGNTVRNVYTALTERQATKVGQQNVYAEDIARPDQVNPVMRPPITVKAHGHKSGKLKGVLKAIAKGLCCR